MDDAQYELIKEMFARVQRENNTPELARKVLQSRGLLDENGELAERYRSSDWQPECR